MTYCVSVCGTDSACLRLVTRQTVAEGGRTEQSKYWTEIDGGKIFVHYQRDDYDNITDVVASQKRERKRERIGGGV